MGLGTIAPPGFKELSSILREEIDLQTEIDVTKPSGIRPRSPRAAMTSVCIVRAGGSKNLQRCPSTSGRAALEASKSFSSPYRVQFVGGGLCETRVPGFARVLREQSIDFGVITNGSALSDERVVQRFVAAHPLKVESQSMGGLQIFMTASGKVTGSLTCITSGIGMLREARREQGVDFPIRIKPVLNALNFRAMPRS